MDKIGKTSPTEKSGSTKKKKNGRPMGWTERKITDLADKLLKWADESNTYALVQFCRNQKIQPNLLSKLSGKNEEFQSALSYAKLAIASRMIENLNSKDGNCHAAFFNKYIRLNDPILDNHLREIDQIQTQQVNDYLVKIVDFSNLNKKNK